MLTTRKAGHQINPVVGGLLAMRRGRSMAVG
jgi:hypothetical protein